MKQLSDLPDPLSSGLSSSALLRRLGFTGYEATVWLELANGYPATAYQVAKRAGLPRANVYRALDRLAEVGAVSLVHSQPATYQPVDPRTMVTRLTAGLSGACDDFVAQMTERMQSRNQGAIRTASGARQCAEQLRAELGAVTQFAWLKGSASTLLQFEREIEAACRRGATVKIIAFGAWQALRKRLSSCTVYPHEGDGRRLSQATDALLTLARDSKAVTTCVFSEEPTVTTIQDHALTYQMHSYLLHEFFLAELVLDPAIGKAIAGRLKELRQDHRPPKMERTLASRAST